LSSRPNVPPVSTKPELTHKPPWFDYIGQTFSGSISFIPRPDTALMAA
jgi:hypothetical protein